MRVPSVQEKKVVVTGCSTGIGAATARVLRDVGWRVVPTARREEDLALLRGEGFEAVALDVADSDSVKQCVQEVLDLFGGRIGGLVNNAGYGQAGAVEDLSREALRRQFEVNVFGMQELTNGFIPAMREQGWGRIVNISSVLGRISVPMMGAYCASKFAMEALSDSLRVELADAGIGVSLVEPGPIESAFRNTAADAAAKSLDTEHSRFSGYYDKEIGRRLKKKKSSNKFMKPPEAVAEKILHALTASNPKARYCVTIPAYLGAWMSRFSPTGLNDRILRGRVPAPGR